MFNIHEYRKILEEIELLGKKTRIIAISKNHPREFVEEALKQGVKIFGENNELIDINNKPLKIDF